MSKKVVFKFKDGERIEAQMPEEDYIEAHLPDKAKLALYIQQAKGANRTMAEFASACRSKDSKSVSASTFSRILNKKITKPLSVELIDTIIANAEDPESLNRDDFLRANGMVPKSEWERENQRRHLEERNAIYEQVKHILADELYARGCMLRIYPRLPREELPESSFYLRCPSRMAIMIQGYEPKFWNFLTHIPMFDYYADLSDEKARTAGNMRDLMDHWYTLFLQDAWEPETLLDVKNSFVFTDTTYYEPFCEMMMNIKVNTYMSVILIDPDKNMVVEEKMIPRQDGKTLPCLFDQKRIPWF